MLVARAQGKGEMWNCCIMPQSFSFAGGKVLKMVGDDTNNMKVLALLNWTHKNGYNFMLQVDYKNKNTGKNYSKRKTLVHIDKLLFGLSSALALPCYLDYYFNVAESHYLIVLFFYYEGEGEDVWTLLNM